MSFNSSQYHDAAEEAREPPRKRAAAEFSGEPNAAPSTTSHSQQQQQQSSSVTNARARFLRELEQYASDDEDDVAAVARSRGQISTAQLAPPLRTNALPATHATLPPFSSSSSPPPSALSIKADGGSDFFFEHAGTRSAGGDLDDAVSDGVRRDQSTASSSTAPSRIGLSLLHRMHAESAAHNSNNTNSDTTTTTAGRSTTTSKKQGPSTSFEVVHTYVPLSTGGFLSTAGVAEDLMEGRQVRVGDVLSLRKLRSATSQPANAPPTVPPPQTSRAGASPASSAVAEASQKVLRHFQHAASFTDNERDYGMRLSPDMVRMLFEVTRVDAQGRSVEGLFLDGTRVKLPFREVRPAGYDEQKRYAQWKADPSSRPVTKIHSEAASPTSNAAPGTHPTSALQPASPVAASLGNETAEASPSASPVAVWWVIPHLLVRIATEAAGDWYGKKCVVKAVRRADNAIRLTEWQDEAPKSGGPAVARSSAAPAVTAETRELIGLSGLETVVPKKGGRAIIVMGPRRGEMCTVRTRLRGADGDLTGVEVEISRTKEVVTLRADELCALAR